MALSAQHLSPCSLTHTERFSPACSNKRWRLQLVCKYIKSSSFTALSWPLFLSLCVCNPTHTPPHLTLCTQVCRGKLAFYSSTFTAQMWQAHMPVLYTVLGHALLLCGVYFLRRSFDTLTINAKQHLNDSSYQVYFSYMQSTEYLRH